MSGLGLLSPPPPHPGLGGWPAGPVARSSRSPARRLRRSPGSTGPGRKLPATRRRTASDLRGMCGAGPPAGDDSPRPRAVRVAGALCEEDRKLSEGNARSRSPRPVMIRRGLALGLRTPDLRTGLGRRRLLFRPPAPPRGRGAGAGLRYYYQAVSATATLVTVVAVK